MVVKNFIIIIFLIQISKFVYAQRTETAIDLAQEKSRLVLEVENDLLFQSDNYYTGGIAFSYTHKALKKTPAQLILNSKSSESRSFSGFGIQQRIFTPYSIVEPNSIENDRPYSAYLLASNFSVLINLEKKLKLSNEIGIGWMGEVARGKEFQTFIHEVVGSPIPIGWDNQLENTFLLDYQFRIEKGFFNDWTAEHFTPFASARIGTLTNRLHIGVMTRFGNKSRFLVDATMPSETKNHFIWEWVFEANLQGVFYDATLEGGLFNDDPNALSKDEFMSRQYQLRTGVNLYYKRYSLRYMVKFNSNNFITELIHRYGSINIGVSF